MRTRILTRLAAAAVVLGTSAAAYAGGFEFRIFDAKIAGLGDAFTAVADTPAAVAANPAGMTQLDGIQVSNGGYLIDPHTYFRADDPAQGNWNGTTEPRHHRPQVCPGPTDASSGRRRTDSSPRFNGRQRDHSLGTRLCRSQERCTVPIPGFPETDTLPRWAFSSLAPSLI